MVDLEKAKQLIKKLKTKKQFLKAQLKEIEEMEQTLIDLFEKDLKGKE